MLDQKATYKSLDRFRKQVVKESRKNAKKFSASGELAKSLTSKLNVSKNSFSLEFLMNEYGNYQDLGVKGKKSSAKAPNSPYKFGSGKGKKGGLTKGIDKWVRIKNIQFRDRKTGRFMSYDNTAFLIRRAIYNKGLEPKLFFTKPFEKQFKKLPDTLIESFALDVEDFAEFTLKNTFE